MRGDTGAAGEPRRLVISGQRRTALAAGLAGAPDTAALTSYLKANATAILIASSDNIFAADWKVED